MLGVVDELEKGLTELESAIKKDWGKKSPLTWAKAIVRLLDPRSIMRGEQVTVKTTDDNKSRTRKSKR